MDRLIKNLTLLFILILSGVLIKLFSPFIERQNDSTDSRLDIILVDSYARESDLYKCITSIHPTSDIQTIKSSNAHELHSEKTISILFKLDSSTCGDLPHNISIKHIGTSGSEKINEKELIKALETACSKNPDVVLLPISMSHSSKELERATNCLVDSGALILASAGNNIGGPVGYPAALEGVWSVGALDEEGKPAIYNPNGQIDILFPGTQIKYINAYNETGTATGTSFAVANAGVFLAESYADTKNLTSLLNDLKYRKKKQ